MTNMHPSCYPSKMTVNLDERTAIIWPTKYSTIDPLVLQLHVCNFMPLFVELLQCYKIIRIFTTSVHLIRLSTMKTTMPRQTSHTIRSQKIHSSDTSLEDFPYVLSLKKSFESKVFIMLNRSIYFRIIPFRLRQHIINSSAISPTTIWVADHNIQMDRLRDPVHYRWFNVIIISEAVQPRWVHGVWHNVVVITSSWWKCLLMLSFMGCVSDFLYV